MALILSMKTDMCWISTVSHSYKPWKAAQEAHRPGDPRRGSLTRFTANKGLPTIFETTTTFSGKTKITYIAHYYYLYSRALILSMQTGMRWISTVSYS